MQIMGEVMVTKNLYGAAVRAVIRPQVIVARISGGLMAGLGLLMLVYGDGIGRAVGTMFVLTGLLVAIVLPWQVVAGTLKRLRPSLSRPWRYEFTDEGVRVVSPIASSDIPWNSLRRVNDYPDFWLLATPIKAQPMVVVKAAFSAEEQTILTAQLPRLVGAE